MAKKDLEAASKVAGETVASIVNQLGLQAQKKQDDEDAEDEEDEDEDDLDDEDEDAAELLSEIAANEIQAAFDAIPANERATTYFLMKMKKPGGRGRGGEPRGNVWATIGKFPFIPGDNKWVENTKAQIVTQHGPGEFEGSPFDQDDRPIKKLPKWSWRITRDEAINLYDWDEEEAQNASGNVRDMPAAPTDDDVEKEKKRALLFEAKISSVQKQKEFEKALGLNEDKKPVADPMVAQLQAQMESERNARAALERQLSDQRQDADKAREENRFMTMFSELKRSNETLAAQIADLKKAPPPESPIKGLFQGEMGQIIGAFIAAAAQRLANPAPPPPPVDPIAIIAQLKSLQPPPPEPIDMMSLARSIKEMMPPPAPPVDIMGIAKTLRDLNPPPVASPTLGPMEMLKFMKDMEKNQPTPMEMFQMMKEMQPASPMQDTLQQMSQMAAIMKTMNPERNGDDDGTSSLEKFANTLAALKELLPEISGDSREPPRSTMIEVIKALKDPIQAAGEALSKSGVIGGGPGAAPSPAELAQMQAEYERAQIQQRAQAQMAANNAAMMRAQGGAQVPHPQAPRQQQRKRVPTPNPNEVVHEAGFGDIPTQNTPSAQMRSAAAGAATAAQPDLPYAQPPLPPVPPQAQAQPAPQAAPQPQEAELSRRDFGEFSRVMTIAIDNKADAAEVHQLVKDKWPQIIKQINEYTSIEEFEKDLLVLVDNVGDQKQHVEQLINRLRSEEGKDWATDFYLSLKGIL